MLLGRNTTCSFQGFVMEKEQQKYGEVSQSESRCSPVSKSIPVKPRAAALASSWPADSASKIQQATFRLCLFTHSTKGSKRRQCSSERVERKQKDLSETAVQVWERVRKSLQTADVLYGSEQTASDLRTWETVRNCTDSLLGNIRRWRETGLRAAFYPAEMFQEDNKVCLHDSEKLRFKPLTCVACVNTYEATKVPGF